MEHFGVDETRDNGIDFLKVLCAFLVVCIHCPPFGGGEFGQYIIAISRAGTTVFFVITGFFLSDIIRAGRMKKYLIKIIKMMLLGHIVYFILYWMISGDPIWTYAKSYLTYHNIRDMILFNYTPISGHLWYLSALIYSVGVFTVFVHFGWEKVLIFLTPFLLIADEVFGKYSMIFLKGYSISFVYIRNWIFVGIPYLCIGWMIYKYELSSRLSRQRWLLLTVFFSITTILERYVLCRMELNGLRDQYFSTPLLSIALFCFFCSSEK